MVQEDETRQVTIFMTKLKIYNSLTKKEEELETLTPNLVKVYSCGPTVYDNPHIGNLATFIRDDLLKRTLKALGYRVEHAMNLTDVEDKIIRDSKKPEFFVEGDEMRSLLNLTAKYSKIFKEDIEKIGNDVDSIKFIKATETIAEMIELTNQLLKNGIAYRAEDGIYFSISKYVESGKNYGIFQKLNLSSARSRIKNDEYEKGSAADFALWKAKVDGEPAWDAEFVDFADPKNEIKFSMPGRPGWHIECSAMSQKLLGVPFDVHTGGIDLKFPHHENEIAQGCGALNLNSFANTFVHMSHILVDGRKMSKSLRNFYTLRDIEEKGFDPMAFRLLVLSGHYRKEINFSWEILEAAQNRLKHWQAVADLRWQISPPRHPREGGDPEILKQIQDDVVFKLSDDLDTPRVLSAIDMAFDNLQKDFDSGAKLNLEDISRFLEFVKNILGIDLLGSDISDEQKELLNLRQKVREDRDFAKSDELREQLKLSGLEVRDSETGQVWSRV